MAAGTIIFSRRSKILSALITIIVFLIIPIIIAFWYIQEITVDKFFLVKVESIMGISPYLISPELNIASSSLNYSENVPELSIIDKATKYLSVVNIKPELIQHSLLLDNSTIKARLVYKKLDSDKQEITTLKSALACDGHTVETGEEKSSEYLIKSGLVLNERSENDRKYVDEIIRTCLVTATVGFKNDFDYPIKIDSLDFFDGNGIRLIIKPEIVSKVTIYLGFFVFWAGFLILIREGPGKLYKVLADLFGKKI